MKTAFALLLAKANVARFRERAAEALLPENGAPERLAHDLAAAKGGNMEAQQSLGDTYYVGNGVNADSAKAAFWHRKAADQGEKLSQYNLAIFLLSRATAADDSEARRWLRQAAAQGIADAQASLGLILLEGRGGKADVAEAIKQYGLAAAPNRLFECAMRTTGQAPHRISGTNRRQCH